MTTENNASTFSRFANHAQLKVLSLAAGLAKYGLDPEQWDLQADGRDTWIIKNRTQDGLSLRGEVTFKRSRWDWRWIELAQI